MPVIENNKPEPSSSFFNNPVEMMNWIFNTCLDGMLKTQTYSKYAKFPGLVKLFKNGATKDMKNISANPHDVAIVENEMKRVYLAMDVYFASKGVF